MTQDSSKIGVALIGAGMIGQSHVAALSLAQKRLRLKVVMSRRPDRARPLSEYYDGPQPVFTSDLEEILQDPDIQMVIVATPPSVRIELIAALAKAGKHILLEKPVGRTLKEAEQVVEICDAAGVTLGVVFQHRMRAPSKSAAHYVASGVLGKIGHVEIAAPLWRAQSYYDELGRGTYERDGGGVLLTQAIHTIDLALSLTGPVISVQAMTATTPLHQMEAEDLAVAGLRFASGAVGSFVASTASFPRRKETITLHGDLGSLSLGTDALTVSWRDGRVEEETYEAGVGGEPGPQALKYAWHQGVIEDFVTAIQSDHAPLVTGRAALHPHALIDAMERSSRLGTRIALHQ